MATATKGGALGIAAAIRSELKARGWNARAVSVRADRYSMGATIYVTVKRSDVPISTVRTIAQAQERVDRCERTGEILSGGNIFVRVEYARDVLDAATAPIATRLAAVKEIGVAVELEHGWRAWREDPDYWVAQRGNEREQRCWGVWGTARHIALGILDSAALAATRAA